MCSVFNLPLSEGHPAWVQATLPVKSGGLGIQSVVQLAPSAFLASAAACSSLVQLILPPHLINPFSQALMKHFSRGLRFPTNYLLLVLPLAIRRPIISRIADSLLDNSRDPISKACLLAASSRESGVWLNVTPVTSLGFRLDNTAVRIAMGLHLGLQLCRPHTCQHCGAEVTEFGTHGLSSRKSAGRHFHHAALNDLIHRALSAAHIPSRLEPSGLA